MNVVWCRSILCLSQRGARGDFAARTQAALQQMLIESPQREGPEDETDGMMGPRPHLAIPGWIWARISTAVPE